MTEASGLQLTGIPRKGYFHLIITTHHFLYIKIIMYVFFLTFEKKTLYLTCFLNFPLTSEFHNRVISQCTVQ